MAWPRTLLPLPQLVTCWLWLLHPHHLLSASGGGISPADHTEQHVLPQQVQQTQPPLQQVHHTLTYLRQPSQPHEALAGSLLSSSGGGDGSSGDDAALDHSYGQYQARSPLMYRMATSYGGDDVYNRGKQDFGADSRSSSSVGGGSSSNSLLPDAEYYSGRGSSSNSLLPDAEYYSGRESRHWTSMDACGSSVCDQVIRQAHSLARIKLLREYIKDTVAMLDQLVTAVDSQIITAGSLLARSVGSGCRAVQPVLLDVTKRTTDADRGRSDAIRTWYPLK